MIWVDYVIIGIIALSAAISLVRGFVREAFSLAVWIIAFWVGWAFFRDLALHLEPYVSVPSVRLGIAFMILLVAALLLGGLINFLVGQVVDKTGLSGTDRLFGMVFGAARGALLVAILVLLAGLTPVPNDPWWQASALIGHFQQLAEWLQGLLPNDIAARFTYA